MKFLKQKLKNNSENIVNSIKNNWKDIPKEKQREFVYALWSGIIPNLPRKFARLENSLNQSVAIGCEGKAWELIINETIELEDAWFKKNVDKKKFDNYFKKLFKNFYFDHEWLTEKEKEDNHKIVVELKKIFVGVQEQKYFKTSFFKRVLLPDLKKSRDKGFVKHCEKWKL